MQQKERQSTSPTVQIKAQGNLLVVKTTGMDADFPPPGGRGDVETFSKASRMRMLRMLARTSPPKRNGFRLQVSFLTLTAGKVMHPRQMKEYMRTFLKRLYRSYKKIAVIWRLEYQERGAPHLHLILYNCPYIDKGWIQRNWGQVIGQDRPFTRIEAIKSYKHLMSYVSKYAAKVETNGFNKGAYLATAGKKCTYADLSPGRVWGVWHRGCLPEQELVEVSIPADGSWWMVRRYCQKFYPWIDENSVFGFTVFTDDPYHALDHIVRMSKMFVNEPVS